MPTIKDSLHFNYNGIWSDTYGLIHVVLDNGMFEETFVAPRKINETKVRGNSKPLFHSIEDDPLEFDMVIAFEDGFDAVKIDAIIRWLFVDYYKPLYFEGKEDKIYYCMPVNDSKIVHTGLSKGYFTLKMRCDSSNVYSPYITTNMETVVGIKTITIENEGHFDIYPEISILKNGNGTVTIQSLDDGGKIFQVSNLNNNEDIYINCEKETIETNLIGVYRYDNIVGDFPRLIYGTNRFQITGDCNIQFRYRNKYRF